MTTPMPQPPGWYHAQGDPPGTHRWWDGARWVGGPVAGAPNSTPGPVAPPGAGSSPYPVAARPDYAGFWPRVGAWLLDTLIVGVPSGILFAVYFSAAPTEVVTCRVDGRPSLCEQPTGAAIGLALLGGLALFVLVLVFYYARPEGTTGQTLGKRALGIRTVRNRTGRPIGTARAVGRFFAHYVSSLLCYLGFFWMLWDDQKQTWHDKICDTVVIRAGT